MQERIVSDNKWGDLTDWKTLRDRLDKIKSDPDVQEFLKSFWTPNSPEERNDLRAKLARAKQEIQDLRADLAVSEQDLLEEEAALHVTEAALGDANAEIARLNRIIARQLGLNLADLADD